MEEETITNLLTDEQYADLLQSVLDLQGIVTNTNEIFLFYMGVFLGMIALFIFFFFLKGA